jgi:hypothetical protein
MADGGQLLWFFFRFCFSLLRARGGVCGM